MKNKREHWYRAKQKEFEEYEKYVSNLETNYTSALEELKYISVGATLAGQSKHWSQHARLMWRAATFLAEMCRKPKVTKPPFYL